MQFGRSPMEHPNLHLPIFLEVCNTLKLNGISTDAIHLCLFSFSLKDKARARLHSLPLDSITTWDELTRAFLAKFFPPSKTPSLRNQITTFTQRRTNHSMKLGSGLRTYCGCALIMDSKSGWSSKPSTMGSLNLCGGWHSYEQDKRRSLQSDREDDTQ